MRQSLHYFIALGQFVCLCIVFGCGARPPSTGLTVSAASDLDPVLRQIAEAFTAKTGMAVTINFGSTGQLAQQIEAGAPVDVFLSANVAFLDDLVKSGLVIAETRRLYARGRLVIWTRSDTRHPVARLEDLASPAIRHVAIAHPEHAPYGMAAKAALKAAGLWTHVKDKLLHAENVRQALEFASSGNADVALVAHSLSRQVEGRVIDVPEHLHPPILQALGVVRGSPREAEARRFAQFVVDGEGAALLQQFGFEPPPKETAP